MIRIAKPYYFLIKLVLQLKPKPIKPLPIRIRSISHWPLSSSGRRTLVPSAPVALIGSSWTSTRSPLLSSDRRRHRACKVHSSLISISLLVVLSKDCTRYDQQPLLGSSYHLTVKPQRTTLQTPVKLTGLVQNLTHFLPPLLQD